MQGCLSEVQGELRRASELVDDPDGENGDGDEEGDRVGAEDGWRAHKDEEKVQAVHDWPYAAVVTTTGSDGAAAPRRAHFQSSLHLRCSPDSPRSRTVNLECRDFG